MSEPYDDTAADQSSGYDSADGSSDAATGSSGGGADTGWSADGDDSGSSGGGDDWTSSGGGDDWTSSGGGDDWTSSGGGDDWTSSGGGDSSGASTDSADSWAADMTDGASAERSSQSLPDHWAGELCDDVKGVAEAPFEAAGKMIAYGEDLSEGANRAQLNQDLGEATASAIAPAAPFIDAMVAMDRQHGVSKEDEPLFYQGGQEKVANAIAHGIGGGTHEEPTKTPPVINVGDIEITS